MTRAAVTICIGGIEHEAVSSFADGQWTHVVDHPCPYCAAVPLQVQPRGGAARTSSYYRSFDGVTLCCGGKVDWVKAAREFAVEAELESVREATEATIEKAGLAIKDRRFADAASLYDLVSKAYREADMPTEAENWRRRANDCREVSSREESKERAKR